LLVKNIDPTTSLEIPGKQTILTGKYFSASEKYVSLWNFKKKSGNHISII